jgi:predicted RNase H-like HicB family nuclease
MAHRFRVIFRLERQNDGSSAWIVEIPSVRGCHSYGRSLAEARRNIREALSLFEEDVGGKADAVARAAVFDEEIRMPARTRAAVQRLRKAREKSVEVAARARKAEAAAARALTAELSLRDAGELLGLSQEGVRKILKAG